MMAVTVNTISMKGFAKSYVCNRTNTRPIKVANNNIRILSIRLMNQKKFVLYLYIPSLKVQTFALFLFGGFFLVWKIFRKGRIRQ
ncbi:MAG: hypothetical protein H7A25_23415 [Leptospiraceae bacterium]|nr:hypothetical protein [Leptospiraceae bacterium]MCP5502869.1 hypothetical protein [Leptospiraceae bacterium]